MFSVSDVVNSAKQPKGGYIPVSSLEIINLKDGNTLNSNENISPSTVGTVVDYISRFLLGATLKEAFKIPLKGAKRLQRFSYARTILDEITGNNNESIIAAVKLIPYDVAFRTGNSNYVYQEPVLPDRDTLENINVMINRTVNFFKEYGPVVLMGFSFPKASSLLISSADGDYLTKTGLWDLKVSKNEPTIKQTLQILIYYLMGITSTHVEFGQLDSIGMFNPRLNRAYKIDIDKITPDVLETVYSDVILYDIQKKYAYEHIEELRETKKVKCAAAEFKKLKKEGLPVSYELCFNAVAYDYKLLKDVPIEYRDANLCTNAIELHCYEEEYDEHSLFLFENTDEYIDNYLKLIPDSSYNEKLCVEVLAISRCSSDGFNRIPSRFMTAEFMAYLVYCKNSYYDSVPDKLKNHIFYSKLSEMEIKCLKECPEELEYMCEKIIVPEIIPMDTLRGVLMQKPRLIKCVPQTYCGYSDLGLLAVKQDWRAIRDIAKTNRTVEMLQVVEKSGDKACEWLSKEKAKRKKKVTRG